MRQHFFTYSLCSLLIFALTPSSYALSPEAQTRLRALGQMSLEDLQEIDVKLDDVFDIFDGLVKKRSVKVASGLQQDTNIAPAVTSLITAQDIEAIGAQSLNEALEMVPGLHVGKRGVSLDYIYTLRGIHTNPSPEVLVLLNGVPIKKAFDGRSDTKNIPASLIARIEVIRGPGSALYGADAFAGVINIITKTAADIRGTELGVRGGSYDTGEMWISHGKNYGDVEVAVQLDWQRSDGYHAWIEEDAQSQLDQQLGSNASLAPGELNAHYNYLHAFTDIGYGKWRWRTAFRQSLNEGSGLGLAQALDPETSGHSRGFSTHLEYTNPHFGKAWGLTLRLGLQRYDTQNRYQMFPPGAFAGLFPNGFLWDVDFRSRKHFLHLDTTYHGWHNHSLRLGIGYQNSELDSIGEQRNWDIDLATGFPYPLGSMTDVSNSAGVFLSNNTRRNPYMYVQDTFSVANNWELTAGLRYDDFSDFGSTLNPRLALVWKTSDKLTSKLLYGSAFRAPTFSELGLNSPLLGLGNKDLQAETIDTYEIAWDYSASQNLHLALNLFMYQIEDKIGFPGGQIQYANYGEWQGRGIEIEARWKISNNAALLFNYAFQDGEDETGNEIADALRQSAYARIDWMFAPNWFLDLNTRWVADRPRASNDTRKAMDDYIVTDLTLRYKNLNHPWNVALGVRNLFDTDAREPTTVNIGVTNDLPLPATHYFAEVRYKF